MSTFPVPPDVRAARSFSVIRGVDTMIREDRRVASSVTALVEQGEWVTFNGSGEVVKASGQVAATPMVGAKCVWTVYKKSDVVAGQSDAAANQAVTTVAGAYVAETKKFDAGGAYAVGNTLVVIDDGAGNGILFGVAAPTATQLAAAVGKVHAPVSNGVLTYESLGAA